MWGMSRAGSQLAMWSDAVGILEVAQTPLSQPPGNLNLHDAYATEPMVEITSEGYHGKEGGISQHEGEPGGGRWSLD